MHLYKTPFMSPCTSFIRLMHLVCLSARHFCLPITDPRLKLAAVGDPSIEASAYLCEKLEQQKPRLQIRRKNVVESHQRLEYASCTLPVDLGYEFR